MNELPNIWQMQTTADLDGLTSALGHPYADVRRRAAVALRIIGESSAIAALQQAAQSEKNERARLAMTAALDHLKSLQEAEPAPPVAESKRPQTRMERLLDYLMGPNPDAATQAAKALAKLGDKSAVPALVQVFHNKKKRAAVRLAAAEALLEMNSAPAEVTLLAALRSEKWHLRRNGAAILGQLKAEWAVGPLADTLYDSQEIVAKTARAALRHIGTEEAREAVEAAKRAQLDTAQLDPNLLDQVQEAKRARLRLLNQQQAALPNRSPEVNAQLNDATKPLNESTTRLRPPTPKPDTGVLKDVLADADPEPDTDPQQAEATRPRPPKQPRVKSRRRKSATERLDDDATDDE